MIFKFVAAKFLWAFQKQSYALLFEKLLEVFDITELVYAFEIV